MMHLFTLLKSNFAKPKDIVSPQYLYPACGDMMFLVPSRTSPLPINFCSVFNKLGEEGYHDPACVAGLIEDILLIWGILCFTQKLLPIKLNIQVWLKPQASRNYLHVQSYTPLLNRSRFFIFLCYIETPLYLLLRNTLCRIWFKYIGEDRVANDDVRWLILIHYIMIYSVYRK